MTCTADFDYELPPELIAQFPLERRDHSRLMVLHREPRAASPGTGAVSPEVSAVRHLRFRDFPSLVEPGDVVVVNDSRVIPARLIARRAGGGAAEVLLVARETDGAWRALVRPGSRIRAGARLQLGEGSTRSGSRPGSGRVDTVEVIDRLGAGERRVRLLGDGGDEAVIARHGRVPLPPYIVREPTPLDVERYQTVYATHPGSVAAPTAGLHLTNETLRELERRGARVVRLTVHVGPGTFRPVTTADPAHHRMDPEAYRLPPETAEAVAGARRVGRAVWAVGTTTVRALETCANPDRTVTSGSGWTSLFIRPGYTFRAVDHLLTNFHLPRSTLLMLVAAFAGRDQTLAAYREAIEQRYRFYSYGDAMAIV